MTDDKGMELPPQSPISLPFVRTICAVGIENGARHRQHWTHETMLNVLDQFAALQSRITAAESVLADEREENAMLRSRVEELKRERNLLRASAYEELEMVTGTNFIEMQQRAEAAEAQLATAREAVTRLENENAELRRRDDYVAGGLV